MLPSRAAAIGPAAASEAGQPWIPRPGPWWPWTGPVTSPYRHNESCLGLRLETLGAYFKNN